MPALTPSSGGPASGSWPYSSHSHWPVDTVKHLTLETPRTTAEEPRWHHKSVWELNAYQSTAGASPLTLRTEAEGLGIKVSLNPLQKDLNSPNQGLQETRSPTPIYWIVSWLHCSWGCEMPWTKLYISLSRERGLEPPPCPIVMS